MEGPFSFQMWIVIGTLGVTDKISAMSDSPSSAPSLWLASIWIPVGIVAIPWIHGVYQQKIARAEIMAQQESQQKQNYLGMALGILSANEEKKEDPLRGWAVDILSKYSPVPIGNELMFKLKIGEATIKYVPPYSSSSGSTYSPTSYSSSGTYTPSYSSDNKSAEEEQASPAEKETGGPK